MKTLFTIMVAAIFTVSLAGCQMSKQNVGAGLGGVAGGVLGSNVGVALVELQPLLAVLF